MTTAFTTARVSANGTWPDSGRAVDVLRNGIVPHEEHAVTPSEVVPIPSEDLAGDEQLRLQEQAALARGIRKHERTAEWRDCVAFLEATMQDRLLLGIRDGQWRPTYTLIEFLEEHIPASLARRRFVLAKGKDQDHGDYPVVQGRMRLINDAVARLRRRGLLAVRKSADGYDEVQATPRQETRFRIDPEWDGLLPRAADETARLEAILLAEDCRDDLVVWKGHDVLVDGHTRFRLMSLLGRPYQVKEQEFADRRAVADWMWQHHYGRRNLTAETKSYVRGRELLALERQLGRPRRRPEKSSHSETISNAAQRVADKYHVSRATVYRDARFAAALDWLAEVSGDAVRQEVLTGSIKLTRRDVQRLAKLAPEDARRIVGEVRTSSKRHTWTRRVRKTLGPLPRNRKRLARMLWQRLGPQDALVVGRMLLRFKKKPPSQKQENTELQGLQTQHQGLPT